ncbi:MAG: FAD-binding oxidoreductase [Deltaproteobacteria bacterium]|nr:FAD-binding oxidoreductase [Deltaproteobacteria bacterium]
MTRDQSWGHYPQVQHRDIVPLYWRDALPRLESFSHSVLPRAMGRSYGDCCLNADAILLDVTPLDRWIDFDTERGLVRCEAGVSLAELLRVLVPRGWFLPVVPGTKFVSVGGAIANDVHGKNHHRAGSFGAYVRRFALLRSDGRCLECSPTEESELFQATIGGLGLTGVILWAELALRPVAGPWILEERRPLRDLDEFFAYAPEADRAHEYTVAWIDALAGTAARGRGVLITGDHAEAPVMQSPPRRRTWHVPCALPGGGLPRPAVRAFNAGLAWWAARRGVVRRVVDCDRFFFPLDAFGDWNRLYGRRGFLQYQCVVPLPVAPAVLREILTLLAQARASAYLSVLKLFGERPSVGLLSFPRAGATLALDLPFRGTPTLQVLDVCDQLVLSAGGAVYPAKDARMSAAAFRGFFPNAERFCRLIDPKFSSSFWRRVWEERGV